MVEIPLNVQHVIHEVLRGNDDAVGRPLPVASTWQTGLYKYLGAGQPDTYLTPDEQVSYLEAGHHWLPVVIFPPNLDDPTFSFYDYFSLAWDKFAEWGIPVTMIGSQWESPLTTDSTYWNLPLSENPNVINLDNVLQAMVDPQGPIEPWYDVGMTKTTSTSGWVDLQSRYPSIPKLIMLSNNEHAKLRAINANTSKRWVDTYGTETTSDFRREKIIEGWEARYSELLRGMNDGFANTVWQGRSIYVGYGVNDVRHFGRWALKTTKVTCCSFKSTCYNVI